jgi:hypothetical protein
LVAHFLHLQSTFTYSLLHFAVLAGGITLLTVWLEHTAGRAAATGIVVLLFASPLSAVLLTWLGQPDVFVVVAGGVVALAAANRTRPTILKLFVVPVSAGLVLGFSAAETSVLALAVLAVVGAVSTRRGRVVLVAAALGLALGRVGVLVFHQLSDAPYHSRADEASLIGYNTLARRAVYNLPALLYSTFGVAWVLVVAWAAMQWRVRKMTVWRAVAGWLIATAIAFVVLDQTRIVTLVLWPASVWIGHEALRTRERDAMTWILLAATIVVATVVPPVVVWDGIVRGATFMNWFDSF